jgi:hypothetical protein
LSLFTARRHSRGLDPLILNLGTRWRGVVKFMPWTLYQRQEPCCPLEAAWPTERVWMFWRIEKHLAPARIQATERKIPGKYIRILLVIFGKIIVNNRFIRTWTETSVTCLKSVFCLYLEKWRKTTKYPDRDVQ